MKTTMDKAGHLVIPRALRSQVGLAEGGEVEVEVLSAAIMVEPPAGEGLATEDPFVVVPRSGVQVSDAEVREQRLADQR